jgi:hypothetical protein
VALGEDGKARAPLCEQVFEVLRNSGDSGESVIMAESGEKRKSGMA